MAPNEVDALDGHGDAAVEKDVEDLLALLRVRLEHAPPELSERVDQVLGFVKNMSREYNGRLFHNLCCLEKLCSKC
ncbi:hypothetical protein DPMN_136594 [Dreissena polymorpha]|uniref:Uncharacterized protein n=1 Tax=Dreissena polymorpha TaxID=45954 RepID=A0A9D4G3L9_DREPO|nr:hypothetical protein DPMN_136594 [Dreissena polymorpha]